MLSYNLPLWKDQINSVDWLKHCDYAFDFYGSEWFIQGQPLPKFKNANQVGEQGVLFSGTTQPIKEFLNAIPKEGNYIIITRDNDTPITEELYLQKPTSVKYWFAINCEVNYPDITAIPYGTNNVGGMSQTLINAIEENERKDNEQIYFRCNIPPVMGKNHERHKCLEKMKAIGATVIEEQIDGYDTFKNMRKHRYIASPYGTGKCCLRHTESILCGSIPILSDVAATRNVFDGLPVIFTTDWDFTMEWLNEQYQKVKDLPTDKVRMSYWIQALIDKKLEHGLRH